MINYHRHPVFFPCRCYHWHYHHHPVSFLSLCHQLALPSPPCLLSLPILSIGITITTQSSLLFYDIDWDYHRHPKICFWGIIFTILSFLRACAPFFLPWRGEPAKAAAYSAVEIPIRVISRELNQPELSNFEASKRRKHLQEKEKSRRNPNAEPNPGNLVRSNGPVPFLNQASQSLPNEPGLVGTLFGPTAFLVYHGRIGRPFLPLRPRRLQTQTGTPHEPQTPAP